MAIKLIFLLIFVHLVQLLQIASAENDPTQQKYTSKCDDLCVQIKPNETEQQSSQAECLRGCQYFNIEFLINARNKDKLIDLNQLVERCGASCSEAYDINKSKKEECFRGCNEMMTLQAKAPFVNGWLVYMGATDRNMVLLQPDFDIPSKEDWVLLDSMFRANDYEYDNSYSNGYEKIINDMPGQKDGKYIGHEHFTINYCIPAWMWMLPLIMLAAFIWIHYSNYIHNMFMREEFEHEFTLTNPNNITAVNAESGAYFVGGKKFVQSDDDFLVASHFYFYPSPAIPPPKYNEIVEQEVLGSNDADETASCTHCASLDKQNENPAIVITKDENCEDKTKFSG